jgi:hypothetical protein
MKWKAAAKLAAAALGGAAGAVAAASSHPVEATAVAKSLSDLMQALFAILL